MKKLMFLLFVLIVFFSCTEKMTDPVTDDIGIGLDNEAAYKIINDFHTANTVFSQNIYKEILSASTTDENIMISPLSISIALSILNNGADGNTKEEIKNVIELENFSDYSINYNFNNLIKELEHYNNVIDLDLANSAWFDDEFQVKQDYVDITKEFFNAEVRNINLDITASIDTINTWVSDKTDGKIEDILTHDDIGYEFFLLNAINFQGYWKCPFDADATDDMEFYDENGVCSFVPTMIANIESEWLSGEVSAIRKFSFLFRDDFKAVKIPYGKKNTALLSTKVTSIPASTDNINMYIFVPVNNLKPFIESELNQANWNDWMNSFISFDELCSDGLINLEFTMPKFSFEYDLNLIPILQNMGMTDAFMEGIANFSEITDMWQGLFISLVKHKTFIEVNEEGTSAAGVTIIGGGYGAPPPEFRVNKPFFFAIRDDLTGTILFMGQVYDPQY